MTDPQDGGDVDGSAGSVDAAALNACSFVPSGPCSPFTGSSDDG